MERTPSKIYRIKYNRWTGVYNVYRYYRATMTTTTATPAMRKFMAGANQKRILGYTIYSRKEK